MAWKNFGKMYFAQFQNNPDCNSEIKNPLFNNIIFQPPIYTCTPENCNLTQQFFMMMKTVDRR